VERGLDLLSGLGLEVESVVANDPFFGRVGRMLAANQRDETLKFEVVTPIVATNPTAVMSANCHRDHFGIPFGIETAAGEVAHSSCVGFGMERITLALLHTHGLDRTGWPSPVRASLWP
jgi:seryl-tRNA synthetase